MRPGPSKKFDPDEAVQIARDMFWRCGYDGTAISQLESTLGIGRKSLYDTFGNKRKLYLCAIEQYADTVVQKICQGLEDPRSSPLENLERVLDRLGIHHASSESLGCLLGVAMAQADPDDSQLAELLNGYLQRLERAFENTIRSAQNQGEIEGSAPANEIARSLVALTQGVALMGRVTNTSALSRSVVRALVHARKI